MVHGCDLGVESGNGFTEVRWNTVFLSAGFGGLVCEVVAVAVELGQQLAARQHGHADFFPAGVRGHPLQVGFGLQVATGIDDVKDQLPCSGKLAFVGGGVWPTVGACMAY